MNDKLMVLSEKAILQLGDPRYEGKYLIEIKELSLTKEMIFDHINEVLFRTPDMRHYFTVYSYPSEDTMAIKMGKDVKTADYRMVDCYEYNPKDKYYNVTLTDGWELKLDYVILNVNIADVEVGKLFISRGEKKRS